MSSHLGRIIRAARKGQGVSQHTLAQHCKISRERISRIELGRLQPTAAEVSAIAIKLDDLNIIRTWWRNSELNYATTYISERMGIQVHTDMEITAQQFSKDIIDRALRIINTFNDLPTRDVDRDEHLKLAGEEAFMISRLATALRLLLCDIK